MSPLIVLLATTAGLLAVAAWWFRPILESVAADLQAMPPRRRAVTPGLADPDCGIGATLMAAAAQGTATAAKPAGGTAGGSAPAPKRPKRKKPTGPDRRSFLRTGIFLGTGGVLGAFGAASIGFLWPRLGAGAFGAAIDLGPEADVLASIDDGGGRFEFPSGRLYMVRYDAAKDPDGQYADITGDASVMAIYQKCVHLGCRVPWCDSSRWFECPCHGSRYNRWGEYEFGPAPRGLDRFPVTLENGNVFVDTATVITGPARTAGVLGEPAAGPNCN
ncbi:ubiquinol-cytochrome c reductase iron-sulfur subunit [Euzebya sp.]|uniref:QcrA and Rieske domain-containing protein n=1 Tax=Euzebya sp. TaxID=1971409 RepID=UPI003516142A